MYRFLAIGCALWGLAACCYCRTSIDASELQQLKIGQTTEDEVKAKFGTPSDIFAKEGDTIWTYSFRYQDDKWAEAIPVAGGLVTQPNVKIQGDSFVFDAQGKLKRYTYSDVTKLPGE